MKLKYLYTRFLLAVTYHLAMIRYHIWFHFNFFRRQPLLVYQMGKVGSKTIIKSLETSHLDMTIYHVHFLSENGIKWIRELYTQRSRQNFLKLGVPEARRALPDHVLTSIYLQNKIKKKSNTNKWKIITIVRDPVAKNVSQFFNWIEIFSPKVSELYKNNALKCEDLVDVFLREFGENSTLGEMPLKWFDDELKQVFSIDVFASNFPKLKGYEIYNGKYANVMLLKLENIKLCAPSAFREFLGIDKFVITNANTANEKEYYSIYQYFLQNVILPESYLEKMYNSKYAQHFYTEAEINTFKSKWRKRQ